MRSSDRARWAAPLLAPLLSAACLCTAHAQDGDKEFDRTPVRCVAIGSIKKTHALEQICGGTVIFVVDRQLRADGAPCALGQLYRAGAEPIDFPRIIASTPAARMRVPA